MRDSLHPASVDSSPWRCVTVHHTGFRSVRSKSQTNKPSLAWRMSRAGTNALVIGILVNIHAVVPNLGLPLPTFLPSSMLTYVLHKPQDGLAVVKALLKQKYAVWGSVRPQTMGDSSLDEVRMPKRDDNRSAERLTHAPITFFFYSSLQELSRGNGQCLAPLATRLGSLQLVG